MELTKVPGQSISNKTALVFLLPVAIIIGTLLVFIFLIPSSYSQFISRINDYRNAKDVEDTLAKKLATLQSISPDVLDKAPQSVTALPDKNPILGLISQVKEIAISNNAVVSSIKTNGISEFENDITRIEFLVGVDAPDFTTIAKIVSELSQRAPASTIDLVQMQDELTSKHANIKISGYWSKLPDTLPALNEPLAALSQDELATLDQISKLTPVQFDILSPEVSSVRENPFD